MRKITLAALRGIIFHASNELHNVTNIGTTPATCFVIGWDSPGAKK